MRFKIMPSGEYFIVRDALGVFKDSELMSRYEAGKALLMQCQMVQHQANDLLASAGLSTTGMLKDQMRRQQERHLAAMKWRSEREIYALKALDEFDSLPWWRKVYWMLAGARLGGVSRIRMDKVPSFVGKDL